MKRCSKCGEDKPPSDFFRDARKRDGLQTKCKVCHAAMARDWEKRNPDRLRQRRSEYREANREKLQLQNKTWVAANPDRSWPDMPE